MEIITFSQDNRGGGQNPPKQGFTPPPRGVSKSPPPPPQILPPTMVFHVHTFPGFRVFWGIPPYPLFSERALRGQKRVSITFTINWGGKISPRGGKNKGFFEVFWLKLEKLGIIITYPYGWGIPYRPASAIVSTTSRCSDRVLLFLIIIYLFFFMLVFFFVRPSGHWGRVRPTVGEYSYIA